MVQWLLKEQQSKFDDCSPVLSGQTYIENGIPRGY